MSQNTKEQLILKHFIKNQRLHDPKNLYRPKHKCNDNKNFIHSDYVYMRDFQNMSSGSVGLDTTNMINIKNQESCNKMGLELPCITITELNNIINSDNALLKEWIKEIEEEINIKQNDQNYQVMKNDSTGNFSSKYNRNYNKNFLNSVRDAYQLYRTKKYHKDSFLGDPNIKLGCTYPINIDLFTQKYKQEVGRMIKSGNLDLEVKLEDLSYLPDMTSFIYKEDAQLDDQDLQQSRDLLKTIMQQITSIEMKSQINKTKIKTLVGQYGVLKKLRQNVSRHIGSMQRRIDNLNVIRGKNDDQIENMRYEIKRLKRSKDNLQREMRDIAHQNKLSASEKNKKIGQLKNVKNELEKENYKLKEGIATLKNNKSVLEDQNKKFQEDLKNAKSELSTTETQLKKISSKLDNLNVDKAQIKEKDLSKEEIKDLDKDLPKLRTVKPSKKTPELKSKSDLIYEDKPVVIPKKRKRGRPRKTGPRKAPVKRKKRVKKTRKQKVDDLSLFDDESPVVKPRRRGPRRSSKIKVKVKRRSRKRKKTKKMQDDDEELIFKFSMRNFM